MTSPYRALLPESIANLRDTAGLTTETGWAVRHRRLLRSGTLAHHPRATLARLTELTGPGEYVDLRTEREIDREGGLDDALAALGWRWSHHPVEDFEPTALTKKAPKVPQHSGYPVDVRPHVAAAATVVERLLSDEGQRLVLVACSLGKDRTGLVVAAVLRWLRIGRREICRDFMLSNRCLHTQRHLLPSRWSDPNRPIARVTSRSCTEALGRLAPPPALDLNRLRGAMLEEDPVTMGRSE